MLEQCGWVDSLTSGMAYIRLPIGLRTELAPALPPLVLPSAPPVVVVVMNTMVEVSRKVRCRWAVVWIDLGSGNEISCGWRWGEMSSGGEVVGWSCSCCRCSADGGGGGGDAAAVVVVLDMVAGKLPGS